MTGILPEILCVLLLSNVASLLAQEEGDVRLVDGKTYLEGRVEIYHDEVWGTVCDDRFGDEEGMVICNSLNFAGLNTAFPRAAYGKGTGQIWMDELACSGSEKRLAECTFTGWGAHDCSHKEDAGVKCDPKPTTHNITALPLRVSCPPNAGEGSCSACSTSTSSKCFPHIAVQGILEAHYDGHWFPVTGDGWGIEESNVACGQLGYSASWPPPSLDQLWPSWKNLSDCGENVCAEFENMEYYANLKEVLLENPVCTGYEQTLLNCSLSSIQSHDVDEPDQNSVATVACGNYPPRTEECFPSNFEVYLKCTSWYIHVHAIIDVLHVCFAKIYRI